MALNKFLIPGAVAISLLVAACGGSSHSSSSASTATSPTPSSSSSASATPAALTLTTAKGPMGTYLTGAGGRALYIWVADTKGRSSCSGACAKLWPPVTASSMPQVGGGASAADLSLISRSDGAKQVAYKGRPLYYYAGDTGAGSTNGQGSDQFGAKWWLISPSGGQVGGSSSAASTSGGSSSSSGGSPYGGSSSGGWG